MTDVPEAAGPTGSGVAMGRLNRRVARTLRIGVAVSAVLMIVGLVLAAAGGDADLLVRSGRPGSALSVSSLLPPSAIGLILVGTVVLAATPLVRVVLSFEYFVSMGDRAFAALTLFVLVVLFSSVAVGVLG